MSKKDAPAWNYTYGFDLDDVRSIKRNNKEFLVLPGKSESDSRHAIELVRFLNRVAPSGNLKTVKKTKKVKNAG